MSKSVIAAIPLAAAAFMFLPMPADQARAESDIAPAEVATYCLDLRRVTALASTREKFASITGSPREGNFLDTTLPLEGWRDCSLYGAGTYTCDSQELATAEAAEGAQAATLRDVKSCLGETWREVKDRS